MEAECRTPCGGLEEATYDRAGDNRLGKKRVEGLGCCSVTQCFMSNLKVPGSSDTHTKKRKIKNKIKKDVGRGAPTLSMG